MHEPVKHSHKSKNPGTTLNPQYLPNHPCTPAVAVVYCAERLNKLGHQHWERFATQPYFDEHGAFFTALVSAPLLACMFIILVRG